MRRVEDGIWNFLQERLVLACSSLLGKPTPLVVECTIFKPVIEDVRKLSFEGVNQWQRTHYKLCPLRVPISYGFEVVMVDMVVRHDHYTRWVLEMVRTAISPKRSSAPSLIVPEV